MKVKRLTMQSFRGIGDLTLNFDAKNPIVLIGVNGVGKSSIMDALSILLSRFMEWIGGYFSEEEIRNLNDLDIFNKNILTKLKIIVSYSGEECWEISRSRNQPSQDLRHEKVKNFANSIWRHWQNEPEYNIPLAVYYPVNRVVLDINLEIPNKTQFRQIDAYENALVGGRVNFTHFFQWFRNREDIESEIIRDNRQYIDTQLETVRRAISLLIPYLSNLRVRRSPPLRMTLQKNGEELIINQLSDGEKCLLAMVGDLARRLAIANPGLENPLEGEGVILIDEIELHLHPKWQREIIPALTRTFPNCQFIVTTHSPQVVSNVKPENVYILEKTDHGVIALKPESSYGRDTNRILEDLMDVPKRPEKIQEEISRLFNLIDEGNLEEARKLRQELAQEIGDSEPEFVRADILMRKKEILKR